MNNKFLSLSLLTLKAVLQFIILMHNLFLIDSKEMKPLKINFSKRHMHHLNLRAGLWKGIRTERIEREREIEISGAER